MIAHALTRFPKFERSISPMRLGEALLRYSRNVLVRQIATALALSAAAVFAMAAASGQARAADLTVPPEEPVGVVPACPPPEVVILYDEFGRPTVPARTEYYYCVTGTTLLPGDIPPPPEYCCG